MTIRHVKFDFLGIDVSSYILDTGYNSGGNLDLFHDENHHCRIGFITRSRSGDKAFKMMIHGELADIEQKENFVNLLCNALYCIVI